MLLDLTQPCVINPSEYVGTLAIRLQTDNRPECGVFSGQHEGFEPAEENQRMPHFTLMDGAPMGASLNFDDLGMYDFILDRPVARAEEHQMLRYSYVVRGWDSAVYVQYQDIWLVTLQELSDGWSVALGRPGQNGFRIILPDYEPGFIARTGARAS